MTHYFLQITTIYTLLLFVRHFIDTVVSMVVPN